ncbi:putative atp/gtp-binding protein [Janibacter sp. HTCC2649]|nr:putative atp/gtp-binding protein [Janibacter sp. HTCC2649]
MGAPPDPRDLAQQAVAVMNLRAVRIGIVPEPRPGMVGLVGMPVWMWAQQPDPTTWGPVTRTASAAGFSVTATAKVTKVVWAMGDGETVVCRTPGTPYQDRYGKKSSPDCGHTYVRQGKRQVRATSYWRVDWSGMGQSGSIPLSFSDSALVTIGEAQVLTQ